MNNFSPLIKLMKDAISKASRLLARDYYELQLLQSSRKSNELFVDKAVLKIKKTIYNELQRVRPEFGIHSLDLKKISTDENQATWVVNIMDGIENFARS